MSFAFATCEPGFEAALKDDVARVRPALRLAFSRPGLVTFKAEGPVAVDDCAPSPYARVWGASLGPAADVAAVRALVPAEARRLHVWAREPEADGAAALVAHVLEGLGEDGRFAPGERALPGELVVDVVVAPGERWLVGAHRHGHGRSPWPAGALPVEVPADAPSRAYAKIEEAIALAGLHVVAGQVAVEIGAAPGGAAYALARRGVTVWGVDPGALDPRVLAYRGPHGAQVHHVVGTLASVRWEELPRHVDWLLLDVNLAPPVALHGLARLVPAWRRHLRGAVLTLKMNDLAMRRGLPTWQERVAGLGLPDQLVAHLPANRQEVCLVALPRTPEARPRGP